MPLADQLRDSRLRQFDSSPKIELRACVNGLELLEDETSKQDNGFQCRPIVHRPGRACCWGPFLLVRQATISLQVGAQAQPHGPTWFTFFCSTLPCSSRYPNTRVDRPSLHSKDHARGCAYPQRRRGLLAYKSVPHMFVFQDTFSFVLASEDRASAVQAHTWANFGDT